MTTDSDQGSPSQFIVRLLSASLAISVLPVLVLNDVSNTLGPWRPETTLERGLIALSLVTLLGVVLGILFSRSRLWLARRCGHLWLALVSVVIALLVCELSVRTWAPAPPIHTRYPNARYTFTPDANVLKGVSPSSTYTINSLGLRGPEPPVSSSVNVLCLGGSTTECVYLDDSKTWPRRLMDELNERSDTETFWVANAGQGSLATGHHRRFLQQSPLAGRFEVVVMLVGLNDLLRELRGLDAGEGTPPVFARSAILELVQRTWNGYLGMGLIVDATGTKLTSLRRLLPLTPDYAQPNVVKDIKWYDYRLLKLIDVCQSTNKHVVFLTQPVTGSVKLRRRLDLAEARNVDLLSEIIDEYNRTLLYVCEKQGVDVIDLSSMNGVDRYFCDHYNFSEVGAAEVARIVAQHLQAVLASEDR